jgi:hypothetical protein
VFPVNQELCRDIGNAGGRVLSMSVRRIALPSVLMDGLIGPLPSHLGSGRGLAMPRAPQRGAENALHRAASAD